MKGVQQMCGVAILACAVLTSTVSRGDIAIGFAEVGSDVVATISGSFDYSSIATFDTGTSNLPTFVQPNEGNFGYSNVSGLTSWLGWSIYENATYEAPFFGGGTSAGNSIWLTSTKTGVGTLYLQASTSLSPGSNEARLRLPLDYVSGSPINGTATWASHSFATLGLASSGTWGWTAENGQKVSLSIVPEPALAASGAVAAVAVAAWLRRRMLAKA